MDGRQWETELRKRLRELQDIEILQPGEHQRLKRVEFRELSRPDQKRLAQADKHTGLYAMALAKKTAQDGSTLSERFLRLTDGKRLRGGRLNIQVFIDDPNRHLVGMNIQLQGQQVRVDAKTEKETVYGIYMRYDLDAVEMGEQKGPVTHFRAHWHLGADPDASEDSDPRMPGLVLDPVAVWTSSSKPSSQKAPTTFCPSYLLNPRLGYEVSALSIPVAQGATSARVDSGGKPSWRDFSRGYRSPSS